MPGRCPEVSLSSFERSLSSFVSTGLVVCGWHILANRLIRL